MCSKCSFNLPTSHAKHLHVKLHIYILSPACICPVTLFITISEQSFKSKMQLTQLQCHIKWKTLTMSIFTMIYNFKISVI